MRVVERLSAAVGGWTGSKRLRMMPTDGYRASDARATVTSAAGGNAVTIAYVWAEEGAAQEGLLVIADGEGATAATAVWLDSWHQNPQWMILGGAIDEAGVVRMDGSYGPDLGWRIAVDPGEGRTLRIGMDNVMPDTGAYAVVEIELTRTD